MVLKKCLFSSAAALLALLAPPLAAQQAHPAPQPVEAVPAPLVARPALWKVADKDTTIYLFGTIHILPKGVEWYDGKLARAFESAQELVTEIPEVPQSETVGVTMRHAALPAGQTLRGMMTDAEKGRYETALAGLGLPSAALDGYKPWFVAVTLAMLPLMKAGYSIDQGVEAQLETRNKAAGRQRLGLETLEYQLGLFDSLPPAVQKTYLFDVIDQIPAIPQDIGKMIAAWGKGDATGLATLLNDATTDPVLYAALLTNRNRNWAGWIDKRLDKPGVVFIAVGAGHLGGKDSVQELLAKEGIKSVRVQ